MQGNKHLVKLSLPLGFSTLLLFILLCGFSQSTRAKLGMSPVATSPDENRPKALSYETGISVCLQTQNMVTNAGFEGGIGWSNNWYDTGDCSFKAYEPGRDSAISAKIYGESTREDTCMFSTPIDAVSVEPGRYYDYLAWIKADLETGDAVLRIKFYRRQGDQWIHLGNAYTTWINDTHGTWVQATGSAQAPADAEYAKVEALLHVDSVGSVWFDDIFLGLATCLDIGKRDEPDPVAPGETLTYTIAYSNTGREKATDVWIIDTYDEYVDFKEADPEPSFGDDTWRILELSPEHIGTITVRVQVAHDTGTRASLVNYVQTLSDEVVDPIYTSTSTSIITHPGSCIIALHILDTQQPGEPGYPTDYDLILSNAGTCDGQADLLATSSLNWKVEIAPTSTFPLPVSNTAQATVSPVVSQHVQTNVTDVTSITVKLICGPPCDKTSIETRTVTTTVELLQPPTNVHLPLVLRQWPPLAPTPELNSIDNPDGNGTYDVSWNTDSLADFYVLEEDTNGSLTDPTTVYTITGTGCSVSGKGAARYYYRVKACNSWGDSAWSDVEAVDVLWEYELNNTLSEANGPLVSDIDYSAHLNDPWDCFKIYLYTGGLVTAELDIPEHQAEGVQLLLHYESPDNEVDKDWNHPYYVEQTGPPGWYYVSIYTDQGDPNNTLYTLRVTFP